MMTRYILTKFAGERPETRSFVDATAAVREWMMFFRDDGDPEDVVQRWSEALVREGHLSYQSDEYHAYVVRTEIY